jgi:hypothetical protein
MCAERDRKTETSGKKNTLGRDHRVYNPYMHIRWWRYYNNIYIVIVVYILWPRGAQECSRAVSCTLRQAGQWRPCTRDAHITICMQAHTHTHTYIYIIYIRACFMVYRYYGYIRFMPDGDTAMCAHPNLLYPHNLNTICRRIIIIIFTGFKTPLTWSFLRNGRNSSGTMPMRYIIM